MTTTLRPPLKAAQPMGTGGHIMIGRRSFIGGLTAMATGWLGGDPGTGRAGRMRGGLPPRRNDQQYRPPGPAGPVTSSAGTLRARRVIISGTGDGWWEYSGTPGAGNPPVAWAVPPGETTDPYGNTLPVSGGVAVVDYSGLIAETGVWLDPATGTARAIINGAVESWHNAVLGSGFTNEATEPVSYQYEPVNGGRVRFRGAVQLTTSVPAGSDIFPLPVPYRPAFAQAFVTPNSLGSYAAGGATVFVSAAGVVTSGAAGGSGNFIQLDGIVIELD